MWMFKTAVLILASVLGTSLSLPLDSNGLVNRPGSCAIPPKPAHGSFYVTGFTFAVSGEDFDSIAYQLQCDPGYQLQGRSERFCVRGLWSEDVGTCQRNCKLNRDPRITYSCFNIVNNGIISERPCQEYEADGATVRAECRSPIHVSYMHCVNGSWDINPTCSGANHEIFGYKDRSNLVEEMLPMREVNNGLDDQNALEEISYYYNAQFAPPSTSRKTIKRSYNDLRSSGGNLELVPNTAIFKQMFKSSEFQYAPENIGPVYHNFVMSQSIFNSPIKTVVSRENNPYFTSSKWNTPNLLNPLSFNGATSDLTPLNALTFSPSNPSGSLFAKPFPSNKDTASSFVTPISINIPSTVTPTNSKSMSTISSVKVTTPPIVTKVSTVTPVSVNSRSTVPPIDTNTLSTVSSVNDVTTPAVVTKASKMTSSPLVTSVTEKYSEDLTTPSVDYDISDSDWRFGDVTFN